MRGKLHIVSFLELYIVYIYILSVWQLTYNFYTRTLAKGISIDLDKIENMHLRQTKKPRDKLMEKERGKNNCKVLVDNEGSSVWSSCARAMNSHGEEIEWYIDETAGKKLSIHHATLGMLLDSKPELQIHFLPACKMNWWIGARAGDYLRYLCIMFNSFGWPQEEDRQQRLWLLMDHSPSLPPFRHNLLLLLLLLFIIIDF